MIRLLESKDMINAASICAMAYPGMNITEEAPQMKFIERLTFEQETENDLRYYGLFSDTNNELIGLYRLHDFRCNVNGEMIRIFGIGMVAVHFFHKKERIAYRLLQHFHSLAEKENVALVSLYPFNPSFYHKMGYGYGPTRYQYRLKPTSFPDKGKKERVVLLNPNHVEEITVLYNDFTSRHHGMIERTWNERNLIKKKASYYAGVYEDDILIGAIAYRLEPVKDSHFLHHDLIVYEWVWSKPSAFIDICSWLYSQQDQVDRIVIRTHDESLMYQLNDPRNDTNRLIPSVYHEVAQVGSGLMYKIISVEKFIETTNFQSLDRPEQGTSITLYVNDTFLPKQDGTYKITYNGVNWEAVKVQISKEEANVSLTISDLSSWWMGCVSLEQFINYGKVQVNECHATDLDRWFKPKSKPICLTSF
ncbi:GNAT family N-acetyltransferase [Paenisporosarcina antarctica]|nr:GNAT family N-acetyltransferase [Paenisporosarcina antarctica]